MPYALPRRLSLFVPVALTALLCACAASGPKPAPAPKPRAAAPSPAPAPRPAPQTPTSSLIVMGTPLPGVPMPLAAKSGPGQPAPVATAPEAKPLPAPSQAVYGQPGAPGLTAPTPKPFTPTPAPTGPGQTPAVGTTPPPFLSDPAAPKDPTAATDSAPVPTPGQAPATPPATAQDGAPTGYGGIPWGSPASQATGLVVHEADPANRIVTYEWPSGPREIAGAPILDAFLEFFQDSFYHVWVDFTGRQAYETALAGLTAAYGPPTTQKPEKNYNAWTLGEVNIYCAFHAAENEGDVSFFYQPIYERLDAARKAARGKARPARRTKP